MFFSAKLRKSKGKRN